MRILYRHEVFGRSSGPLKRARDARYLDNAAARGFDEASVALADPEEDPTLKNFADLCCGAEAVAMAIRQQLNYV